MTILSNATAPSSSLNIPVSYDEETFLGAVSLSVQVFSPFDSLVISVVAIKPNVYSSLVESGWRAASGILRVSLFLNKEEVKLSNLLLPISLHFPLITAIPQLSFIVDDVFFRRSRLKS